MVNKCFQRLHSKLLNFDIVEVQCKDRTRRLRKTIVALGKRQQASFTATTCVSCCASLFIDDDRRSKGVLLCFERSLLVINFENNTRINVVRGF